MSRHTESLREHRAQHHPDAVRWCLVGGPCFDGEALGRCPVRRIHQLTVLEAIRHENHLPDIDVAGNEASAGLKDDDWDSLIRAIGFDRDHVERDRPSLSNENAGQQTESGHEQMSSHDALDTVTANLLYIRNRLNAVTIR